MIKIIVVFCFLILSSTFMCIGYTNNKTNKGDIIVSNDEKLKKIDNLESIQKYVNDLDIGKFSKEKILKTVEFELELIQRELQIELGKIELERLRRK